ncbi:root hair defective 3 GTP-binding protein [Linderina pennispora]|uniref:Root hair defective 3 GTP-binding protein n=1 Tax=Linderina pennispora TaxID=61395 RepID=A0A1Y1WL63_9FUNG|nr:root hair defective 3 GTP-binding protein [Linderina pennispora]ORX74309.1 root hair defective 3 GTP-binding protein [Linderina pennispora]
MNKKWSLCDAGFDYNVVAVFGSQSTGKSTLLNRLFGTKFDVMDEHQRQQTTRGIWADRGVDMNVLILDVEGTDGRERGENQDFERKSALFSLAVSEVLIVNMWENMVGLYNGANMGLLKTVLEVNLQLFGGNRENKTLLYFVIRDHVSPTPLENLAGTLHSDLERIWASVNKPSELQNARLTDYFDLKFTSLPHKLLQPENFEREALELRSQFTDRRSKEYVFKPSYKRRVPADGFPHYAEAVWDKVVSNKDLDLPTQQELLAQYRCDEIAQAALVPFRKAIDEMRPLVQEGDIVPDLGQVSQQARDTAIEMFDSQAARYHKEVYRKKREAFVQLLDGELHAVFVNQVKNALALATEKFANESHKRLEEAAAAETEYSFGEVVGKVRRHVTESFRMIVNELVIPGGSWTFGSELKQLETTLDATTAKLRLAEMDRALAKLRRTAKDTLGELIEDVLNNPDAQMWSKIIEGFETTNRDAEDALQVRITNAEITSEEAQVGFLRKLHTGLWEDLVDVLKEEVADQMVLLKLRNALEDKFRYDEAGLPRVWKPSDDIDSQFAVARESAQSLLPMFSKIVVSNDCVVRRPGYFAPNFELDRSLVLISGARLRELGKRFGREADALYLEAKRAMVSTQNHVPLWVMALLVVLGWNEAMTILFNPIYLVLTALLGGVAFIVHNLRLWGPVIRAANGLTTMANDKVHEILVEAVNRTEPPVASGSRQRSSAKRKVKRSASASASEEIELEPLGSAMPSPDTDEMVY